MKRQILKTLVPAIFAFTIVHAVPTQADSVVALDSWWMNGVNDNKNLACGGGCQTGSSTWVRFQLSSSPGVWIRTAKHTMVSAALVMARALNYGNISVTTSYNPSNGNYQLWSMGMSTPTWVNNEVNSLLYMSTDTGITPDNFTGADFGTGGYLLTTPEQSEVAALSLISRLPVTYTTGCSWYYNSSTNSLESSCSFVRQLTLN
jgi:hypothetical protein